MKVDILRLLGVILVYTVAANLVWAMTAGLALMSVEAFVIKDVVAMLLLVGVASYLYFSDGKQVSLKEGFDLGVWFIAVSIVLGFVTGFADQLLGYSTLPYAPGLPEWYNVFSMATVILFVPGAVLGAWLRTKQKHHES